MAGQKRYTYHVISHTHWDREWYQPFQGYRRRLVCQMDALLDVLELRGREYRHFHLDGQTAVLDDYLAIRPEQRARLARHIRSGQIVIGPWFVMPDESLASGEALVRNLLLGDSLCKQWSAEPMPLGFVSDVFGHVSQLPQILMGFGIDAAWLHRGTGAIEDETSEMVWQGADGTRILLVKCYPHTGYQDFQEFRNADAPAVLDYMKKKIALSTAPVLFGMDGNDHQPARWDTPEVIDRWNALLEDVNVVHSSFPRYLAQLKKAMGKDWQKGRKRLVGELRTPAKGGTWSDLLQGTGSSRLPIKQANDYLEQYLARVAEPLNAWAKSLGGDSQKSYLDLAWRYLLLNHPHDSIVGCSLDQVHRDMTYRFDQSRMLAEGAASDSFQDLAFRMDDSAIYGEWLISVFNPATAATGPVTMLQIEFPQALASDYAERGMVPTLTDEAGNTVPFETLDIQHGVPTRHVLFKTTAGNAPSMLPRTAEFERHHLAALTSIPALSYRTYQVRFVPANAVSALPRSPRVKVDAAKASLSNEYVQLVARRDGHVDLLDKRTGTWFRDLHELEDCGDVGQGWDHFYPEKDTVIRSSDPLHRGNVHIAVVREGELTACLRVSLTLRVPADVVDENGQPFPAIRPRAGSQRSGKFVDLPVETTYTLTAGSARVDCRTHVVNAAKRHRLRAIFPTDRTTDAWYRDSAFDLVRRDIALPATVGWKEAAREEQPFKSVLAVCDAKAGLAVLTKGLNESAVQDNGRRSIALTLFRGFEEWLGAQVSQESLLLGNLVMEYALLPFTPTESAPPAELLAEVDRYKLPLPSLAREKDVKVAVPTLIPADATPELAAALATRKKFARTLPLAGQLLEMPSSLALSTIKLSQDGAALIVRLWNPQDQAVTASIRPGIAFTSASQTDMREQATRKLPVQAGRIELHLRGKEIVTIRIE